jgi:hypothetical protein
VWRSSYSEKYGAPACFNVLCQTFLRFAKRGLALALHASVPADAHNRKDVRLTHAALLIAVLAQGDEVLSNRRGVESWDSAVQCSTKFVENSGTGRSDATSN